MDNRLLNQAREYELTHGQEIGREERPTFHVTATTGWLNDPNGFSYYKGEIHLFYQYYPYDTVWGPMHWGHLKSKDFIRWERLPAVMAPDEKYDRGGCFSGSAVELPDGQQMLMYTGVEPVMIHDRKSRCQTQCLAFGDGVNYEKYAQNPVLTIQDMPKGSDAVDFRDPKIWKEDAIHGYRGVLSSRTEDGSGAVYLIESSNAIEWHYVSTLARSRNQFGKMWECPDFFHLDGADFLIVCPMSLCSRSLEYLNGNTVIGFKGKLDEQTLQFTSQEVMPLDYGLDFYAPQTLLTPDHRRIMIGWMQAWENSTFVPEGAKWYGMLTLPRELSYTEGELRQSPVRELNQYRTNPVKHKGKVKGHVEYPDVSGRTIDMVLRVHFQNSDLPRRFRVNFAQSKEYCSYLEWDEEKGTLYFDRTFSGFPHNIVMSRSIPFHAEHGELKLRMILDRFSVEIFVGEGEKVITSCLYTPLEAEGISFDIAGEAFLSLAKYDLNVPD